MHAVKPLMPSACYADERRAYRGHQSPQPAGLSQPQGSGVGSDADDGGNGKQVSTSDIQRVQNYIEKCLQMYLTQKEASLHCSVLFRRGNPGSPAVVFQVHSAGSPPPPPISSDNAY